MRVSKVLTGMNSSFLLGLTCTLLVVGGRGGDIVESLPTVSTREVRGN